MTKKLWISTAFSLLLALLAISPTSANTDEEASTPQELCLPGVYLNASPDCSVLGPSAYMTEQASIIEAINTQAERFPQISEDYGQTDVQFFRVRDDSNAYFSTYETALYNTSAAGALYDGYTFAAYTNKVQEDNVTLYQLTNGNWMRGSAVAYLAPANKFLGVTPTEQPERMFGWLVQDTPTLEKPGYYMPKTGNVIPRYTFVEVFDQVKIGLSDWYMIAPDEWIHMTQAAMVYPSDQYPEGWQADRWIEINLWEQTIVAHENGQIVFATLITTGSGNNFTRPGLFKIDEKLEATDMAANLGDDGAYYLMSVPWTMYFDERRALHAEYWHDHLGYKSSHGCVNLSFPDAEWLYDWGEIGDWVFVWDPSGLTPEEPKLFTQYLDH